MSLNVYNVHNRFVLSVIGIEERGWARVHVYVENCARGGGQAWIHDGPEPTLGIKVEEEREKQREREREVWMIRWVWE